MAITADAPRGRDREEIDVVTYSFLLRNREIEWFETKIRAFLNFRMVSLIVAQSLRLRK